MQDAKPLSQLARTVALVCLLAGCRSIPDSGEIVALSGTSSRSSTEIEASTQRVEAQARYASGLSHDLNRRPDQALDDYILSLEADPSNEQLAVEVSRRLVLTKQYERAVEVLENITSRTESFATLYAQLGVLYAELDRFEDAVAANRRAMELAPDALISYHNLYSLYAQNNRLEDAVAVLDSAGRRESDDANYWLDLAELYANFFRNHPAERALVEDQMKSCLTRAETLGVTGSRRLKLADGYTLTGDNQKAVDLLLQLLEEYEDDPGRKNTIRQKLLSIYISTDDADGALTQLESLVQDYPTNPQANFLLASFAQEKEQFEKAIEYFQKTIQLDPKYEQAYYSLAALFLDQQQAKEAVALLETARDQFEESFIVEYYLAVGYGMLEAHEAAVEHYTKAEILGRADERVNLDHRFYFGFGAQQERLKLYDQAADTFQRCLKLKSDFAPALNYLGYMWADLGIHLEDARDCIQKAVDQDPENSAYLDSLAWVFFKLDQPHLALVHMQDAIKFHGDEEPDPVLYDHLGDIQQALGNVEEARAAWTKSLELKEDPAVQKKLNDLPQPVALE